MESLFLNQNTANTKNLNNTDLLIIFSNKETFIASKIITTIKKKDIFSAMNNKLIIPWKEYLMHLPIYYIVFLFLFFYCKYYQWKLYNGYKYALEVNKYIELAWNTANLGSS